MQVSKSTEELRTSIISILNLPDSTRHAFYETPEGQALCKGIVLTAENNINALKNGMRHDPQEIETTYQQILDASPEDREILLQLLPGVVAGVVRARLKEQKYNPYGDWVKMNKSEAGIEKGVHRGDPLYQQWLEKLRQTRVAKRANPDAKTRPTKFKPGQPKSPMSSKHFIRETKPGAKIVDRPIRTKAGK